MQITITLPGCKQDVNIRSIRIGEKDLFTNPAEVKNGRALRQILKKCIQTPDIDLNTMLTCDYNALLIGVRRATYGDDCDFIAQCPFCNHGDTYTADLSQMPVLQGDRKLVDRQLKDPDATHPYTFPECGRTARFRLERGCPKTTDPGKVAVQTLQRRIVAVDGLEKTGMPLLAFLGDELTAGDACDFLEYYNQVSPGIDDEVQLNCTECGVEFQTQILLDYRGFFRRSKRKNSGRQNSALPAKAASHPE